MQKHFDKTSSLGIIGALKLEFNINLHITIHSKVLLYVFSFSQIHKL